MSNDFMITRRWKTTLRKEIVDGSNDPIEIFKWWARWARGAQFRSKEFLNIQAIS